MKNKNVSFRENSSIRFSQTYFSKIKITNFHEQWRKLSLMFFSKDQVIKDVWKKPRNTPISKYKTCIISNPDSLGVKYRNFQTSSPRVQATWGAGSPEIGTSRVNLCPALTTISFTDEILRQIFGGTKKGCYRMLLFFVTCFCNLPSKHDWDFTINSQW